MAVRQSELASGRKCFEQRDRLLPDNHRVVNPADVTQKPRERTQRVSLPPLIPDGAMTLECAFLRG